MRAFCEELGNALDLVRLRWAEGRILAGTRELGPAVQVLLDEVRPAGHSPF